MLRITTIEDSDTPAVLRVEGLLTGPAVQTLLNACRSRRMPPGLDLSGVSFADAEGLRAVESLLVEGLALTRCSPFVHELLGRSRQVKIELPGLEAPLLVRLRAGDERAYEALVADNAPRMLATATRILGSEDEAADVVQEAFVRAVRGLGRFRGASRISTWLHRITVNEALQRLRSRRRAAERPIEELLPRFDDEGRRLDVVPPWSQTPDELLQCRETRQAVHRCMERLPQDYRLVLLLRDVEGLDTQEAANALGVRPGAVKTRLHRARLALRELLERELLAAAPTIAA